MTDVDDLRERNAEQVKDAANGLLGSRQEATMLRRLGRGVIDVDEALSEFERLASVWVRGELPPLRRAIRKLQAAAEEAYDWHVGKPIPRDGDPR
jgi:hypothetical protein